MRLFSVPSTLRLTGCLILAVASVFPQGGVAQMPSMDLRESSSIFSRSSARQRAPQAQSQTPAPQAVAAPASQATLVEDQSSGARETRMDASIKETNAFKQLTPEEADQASNEAMRRTAASPSAATGNMALESSDVVVAPLGQATESSSILPLPSWESVDATSALKSQEAPTRSPGEQPAGNYVLSPNDYVEITVFQENDLATEARISQDGTINFPLIGVTQIGGRTVNEAVEMIRRKLDADYIVNPQVNLKIIEYTMGRFTILGEVQRPGSYNLPRDSDVTLLDAIGSAGGFTRTARTGKVTVKRNVGGKEEVITLDAKRMSREGVQPFIIQAGDTINVPTTFF
ncbi:polysaccharide export protein [Phragmitibacter flavus]|uniref:Polysaccharide export protein n=1 Tax=Phragmitibacter flavus TaxID=2576071 RepID=A0A5R8K805_9BACT|nr:polysaccharide biosynthesis/export family protein [Phragmitibacter flavus]TLD68440.1 polysaccharide export protein [Phragmitibacter flavus]